MISPIRDIQALITAPRGEVAKKAAERDPFAQRLANAVDGLHGGSPLVGARDIAALLRQSLVRASEGGAPSDEIRVPRGDGWPDENLWKEVGCQAHRAGPNGYLVQAHGWSPEWLDGQAGTVVESAARELSRREVRSVPSDPVVQSHTHLTTYVTPGQRAAVRAAFLMRPGATTIVNLPTGGGKTLAFQLPALVGKQSGGFVLVIVPTVALAKDQEARFARLLESADPLFRSEGAALTYHSGLDEAARTGVFRRIREGQQQILFTSPEAVVGALSGPLFDAARRGTLRWFVVDEAHLVAHWGQQFRPEFQTLAGIRESLLAVCPTNSAFRTLLLSGTLTAESFSTLRELFGGTACEVVSESFLRSEPGFLIHGAANDAEQVLRVIDGLNHLPRPTILYTTLREDAQGWYLRLQQIGYRRIGLMRGGDAADAQGDDVLRRWRMRELDIMVATSAFGLGMDQDEVRSVIHACVPETVDRFYQEVGRAGRDGRACVSLLVSTPTDFRVAEQLATDRLISIDRAFERWSSMWHRNEAVGDGLYRLCLDDRPSDLLDMGQKNASWNLRTLVLMARAGVITFAAEDPRSRQAQAAASGIAASAESLGRHIVIRICDASHLDKQHWEAVVASVRDGLKAADRAGVAQIRELRALNRPLNDLFREIYTIDEAGIRPSRLNGNCPVTRSRGSVSHVGSPPEVLFLRRTAAIISNGFLEALVAAHDGQKRFLVAYGRPNTGREKRETSDQLVQLATRAARAGFLEFAAPASLLGEKVWSSLIAQAPLGFPIVATDPESYETDTFYDCPRMTVIAHGSSPESWISALRLARPAHLLVIPSDTQDPSHPQRKFFDVRRFLTIEEALARLES